MERLRLWRYKKLTNENVKKERTVIEKHSDDEDYNSCFKLKKQLKNSCRKMILKQQTKKVSADDSQSAATEEKFIKKLKAQQKDKQDVEQSRKTLHKCLHKILNRNRRSHQLLNESAHGVQDETSRDAYLQSGIYDKFGNSCTESLKPPQTQLEVHAEDFSSCSWYHEGIIGKFSVELLTHQSPGSFIIHRASPKSGNFILSLRVPSNSSKVVHHLILQSKRGYRLKGATKLFPTVAQLVTHHSVMAEQLPVALSIQRPVKSISNDDFSSLDDLSIVFTDLEMEE